MYVFKRYGKRRGLYTRKAYIYIPVCTCLAVAAGFVHYARKAYIFYKYRFILLHTSARVFYGVAAGFVQCARKAFFFILPPL